MPKEATQDPNETHFALPQGWASSVLSDFAHVEAGQSPPGESYNDSGLGTPFFQGKAEFGTLYPTVRKWTHQPTKFAGQDDILLSIRAPVGPTNLSPGRVAIGRGLAGIHPQGEISPLFVLYGLRSKTSELAKQATGTTFSAVSADVVRSLFFPLPPLREQERIVATLEELFSRLDAGLEAVKRTQALLKRYRQSVLRAAVSGELTREWREAHGTNDPSWEPAEQLLQRILTERRVHWKQSGKKGKYVEPKGPDVTGLPELPEGWTWANLNQLSHFITSGSRGWADYYADEGAVFIRAQDIKTDTLNIQGVAHVALPPNAEGLRTRVQNNDLLVTITGANVTKAARVTVALDEAYVSQHVALTRFVTPEISPYVYLWVIAPTHGRRVLERNAYGAGKPGLNLDHLRDLIVALPPTQEQIALVLEVERRLSIIDGMEDSLNAEVRRAMSLRQSILHRAFKGQLVPQDPSDEPASELLNRIQEEREAVSGIKQGQRVKKAATGGQKGRGRPRTTAPEESGESTLAMTQKRSRRSPRKAEAIPMAASAEDAVMLLDLAKQNKKASINTTVQQEE